MGMDEFAVRIEGGKLREDSLFPLFCAIRMSRAGGSLLCRRDNETKEFWFSHGWVVGSQSTEKDDWIGRLLLSWNVITPEIAQYMDEKKERGSLRYGERLMALKAIDRATLEQALRKQVLMRVGEIFSWTEGDYVFSPGEVEPQIEPLSHADVFGAAIRRQYGERGLRKLSSLMLDKTPLPIPNTMFEAVVVEDAELNELFDRITGRIPFRGLQDQFDPLRFWQNVLVLQKLQCIEFDMPETLPEYGKPPEEDDGDVSLLEKAGIVSRDLAQMVELAKVAFHQGKLYLRKRQLTEAELAFFKASVLVPQNGDFLSHLAWTRVLQAPDDKRSLLDCADMLRHAVKMAPRSADALFFLAGTLRFLGENETAKHAFEKVLELKPDHHEARLIVETLRRGK